jgi:hypothetical protein
MQLAESVFGQSTSQVAAHVIVTGQASSKSSILSCDLVYSNGEQPDTPAPFLLFCSISSLLALAHWNFPPLQQQHIAGTYILDWLGQVHRKAGGIGAATVVAPANGP